MIQETDTSKDMGLNSQRFEMPKEGSWGSLDRSLLAHAIPISRVKTWGVFLPTFE